MNQTYNVANNDTMSSRGTLVQKHFKEINESERDREMVDNLITLATEEDILKMKDVCRLWQYKSSDDKEFKNYCDMKCIAVNYCFMIFQNDNS